MRESKQRSELHKQIWGIANTLRGAVEGWDFRNYVLGFLFYRYISEDFADYAGSGYADASDNDAKKIKEKALKEKGYFILPSELFKNVKAEANGLENIEKRIKSVFRSIEESGPMMTGLFSQCDPESEKLGLSTEERRKNTIGLLRGIGDMKLDTEGDNKIDVFGDAYEYLISMYASSAGKLGGECYSPQCLSRLTALIGLGGRKKVRSIYDPAAGSGSLLMQPVMMLGSGNIGAGVFCQDISPIAAILSRMNMILHGLKGDQIHMAVGNTVTAPVKWGKEPFDLIVCNPPFSVSVTKEKAAELENDERFSPAGTFPPYRRVDMAFVMHCASCLADDGTAAIICYPGILYRIGKEKEIRKYLADSGIIDAVIQLPKKMFFGTKSQVCLLVLRKERKDRSVLFADASSLYRKEGKNNILTESNIQELYRMYMDRNSLPEYARLVSPEEIAEAEYNLLPSVYISERKEDCDITLREISEELEKTVKKEEELRRRIRDIVAQFPE